MDEGDEIAWHPHLYFWDNVVNQWVQKIDDESFTLDCLEQDIFHKSSGVNLYIQCMVDGVIKIIILSSFFRCWHTC